MRWLDGMKGYYPPRFSTLEGAQNALYHGDFSEQVLPLELKYDGKTVMLRQEYKDAPYEIQWLTREGGSVRWTE